MTELLDRSVERDARGQLDEGLSRVRRYGAGGEVMGSEVAVYIQAFETQPRMVIFGAIDFSAEMAKLASEVGYQVTICDARRPFADSPRFSRVAEVVVDWPDRYLESQELGPRDVVLVFTHDAKFDEPALTSSLATDAGYIGALGSRRTQERRVERLREAGLDESSIARIHAPCGLDVGARTPVETAVSILAEVIAVRTGRGGESLRRDERPDPPRRGDDQPIVRLARRRATEYDRFRLVSRSLPIRAVLAALVCLVALPASASALPGNRISAKPSAMIQRVDYPGMQRLHYEYGPIAITPGQNTIEIAPQQPEAEGARLHHALQAEPRLREARARSRAST